MFTRILVPLDGSPLSEQVLPTAKTFAHGLKIPIHLVRAYSLSDADWVKMMQGDHGSNSPQSREVDFAGRPFLARALDYERARAETYLQDIAKGLGPEMLISWTVCEGAAAEVILTQAQAEAKTLVMMTTHGRSGIARWILGSVAQKVLGATSTPLVLVRAQSGETHPSEAVHSVVLALDGTAIAEQALPYAAFLGKAFAAPVIPLSVIPALLPFFGKALGYSSSAYEDTAQEMRAFAVRYLEEIAQRLTALGAPEVRPRVRLGEPATAIAEAGRDQPDPLLILTSHRLAGLEGAVVGSVINGTVRSSTAPVLIVPPDSQSAEDGSTS